MNKLKNMTKANKPSAKRASIAPADNAEQKNIPVSELIYDEVKALVDKIEETRRLLSGLEQALTPIVRTTFAQADVDITTVENIQLDSELKAFTYTNKVKEKN